MKYFRPQRDSGNGVYADFIANSTGVTAPTVEAGPNLGVQVDVPIALQGSVTPGTDASPTIAWSILSGGTGTFSDASSPTSTFTPDAVGEYSLRLTANPSDTSPVVDDMVLTSEAPPEVISITDVNGGQAIPQGTSFIITGTLFTGQTQCFINGVEQADFSLDSATQITCTCVLPDTLAYLTDASLTVGSASHTVQVAPRSGRAAITMTSVSGIGVIEAIPDLKIGDQVDYQTKSGNITVNADGTVNATTEPDSFLVRAHDGTSWGNEGTVTVQTSAAPVIPPTVEAGDNKATDANVPVQLSGSITQGTGTLVTLWTIVSGGPGDFSNSSAATSSFTPHYAGTYVLQLSGNPSDGDAVTDTMQVVSTAKAGGYVWPLTDGEGTVAKCSDPAYNGTVNASGWAQAPSNDKLWPINEGTGATLNEALTGDGTYDATIQNHSEASWSG